MKYYSSIKENGIRLVTSKSIQVEDINFSEISQIQKDKKNLHFYLYEGAKIKNKKYNDAFLMQT